MSDARAVWDGPGRRRREQRCLVGRSGRLLASASLGCGDQFLRSTTPQAIRAPAFPAGSDFMSSGEAWRTTAVPPSGKSEPGAGGERGAAGQELALADAVRAHGQVGHVAGVGALRVLEPVLPRGRVEVAARRLELGPLALADGVNVEPVEARRNPGDAHGDLHPPSPGVRVAVPTVFPCASRSVAVADGAAEARTGKRDEHCEQRERASKILQCGDPPHPTP